MSGARTTRLAHRPWPWLDRGGRVSAFKSTAFALTLLPGLVLAGRWTAFGLGARPLTEAIHVTGLWSIRLLVLSLAITPAKTVLAWGRLPLLRRMTGLAALGYGLAHLLLYVADQNWRLGHVVSEIVLRLYLTIGFAALLGMAVLGATSTDGWIRRLGRRWKRLHRLAYGLIALAVLHYLMQSKAQVDQAAVWAGLVLWLFLWRLLPARLQRGRAALFALVPACTVLTALLEAGWYGVATRVHADRILAANWTPLFWPRPAMWVASVTLLVALAGLIRLWPSRGAGTLANTR